MCVCVCNDYSKSSLPYSERSATAEHFCCSNITALFIKQEKSKLVFLVL